MGEWVEGRDRWKDGKGGRKDAMERSQIKGSMGVEQKEEKGESRWRRCEDNNKIS